MKRLAILLGLLLLAAPVGAQIVTNPGGRSVGSVLAYTSSSTITTTSSSVSISGATPVLRVTVMAPSTNGDRIYFSKTAPATASDTPLNPGQSMTFDCLSATLIAAISASGTQSIQIVITRL